jgi:hypothetical protein
MKRTILLLLISVPMLLGFAPAQSAADSTKKEEAVVDFTDKTKVGKETLLGKYLFEHDDSRMARGEPCMYVYSYEGGKQGKLIVSFHCTPAERPRAREVILNVGMTSSSDLYLLLEIQFAGTTKGHIVPAS